MIDLAASRSGEFQKKSSESIDRDEELDQEDDDDDDDNQRGLTELVRDVVGEIFRAPLVPEMQF